MLSWLGIRKVFVATVALGLFAMAVRPATDPDLWWHLRTGQLTLQNHTIFHADPYSFTRNGAPWVNHEWLSEVLMFAVYRRAGWGGLIAAFAILTTAGFLLLLRRCGRPLSLAAALTVWAALASLPTWGVRPQVISFFFVSLFLFLIDYSEEHARVLLWLPPLTLFWVNLHAGYAAGIGVIALALLGDAIDLAVRRDVEIPSRTRPRWLAIILIACLGVVPFNPNGVRMFWYPFQTLASTAMQSHIAEWFSPDFHQPQYWPLLLMICASLLALSAPAAPIRGRTVLLLLVTTYAALHSVRHIPIYVLVAVPLNCQKIRAWLYSGRPDETPPARASLPNAFVAAGWLVVCGLFTLVHMRSTLSRQETAVADVFPERAVSYLAAAGVQGPLLNQYDWGGYLLWRLYPQYRVYIDGRADVYGNDLMEEFNGVTQLKSNWQDRVERWGIRAVLLPPNTPLVTALKGQPGWAEAYADQQAIILTKP